jgi:hypothetical protein
MSLPVAVTISWVHSLHVLHQNLEIARGFQPQTTSEMQTLRDACGSRPQTATWSCSRPLKHMTGIWNVSSMAFHRLRNFPRKLMTSSLNVFFLRSVSGSALAIHRLPFWPLQPRSARKMDSIPASHPPPESETISLTQCMW